MSAESDEKFREELRNMRSGASPDYDDIGWPYWLDGAPSQERAGKLADKILAEPQEEAATRTSELRQKQAERERRANLPGTTTVERGRWRGLDRDGV